MFSRNHGFYSTGQHQLSSPVLSGITILYAPLSTCKGYDVSSVLACIGREVNGFSDEHEQELAETLENDFEDDRRSVCRRIIKRHSRFTFCASLAPFRSLSLLCAPERVPLKDMITRRIVVLRAAFFQIRHETVTLKFRSKSALFQMLVY
jgi:hypothetical protein